MFDKKNHALHSKIEFRDAQKDTCSCRLIQVTKKHVIPVFESVIELFGIFKVVFRMFN